MRAVVMAVLAAIEAAAVALLGLLVVSIPPLLLWAITFDLAAEPRDVFGGAFGVWFLAHLVPLHYELTAESAVALGLPQEGLRFGLSLPPLGITLVTVGLAVRSGWRAGGRGGHGAAAALGGAFGFGALAAVAYPVAHRVLAWPAWLAIAVPALVFGLSTLAGFAVRAAREEHPWWLAAVRSAQRGIERFKLPGAATLRDRVADALRLAVAAVMALIAVAALGVAVAIVVGYVQIAGVSQALQLDPLGALLLFLLQLAFLPTFIVWSAAWLTGAGFSVGAGTSVTPFETLLGPMPSLPVFGAIPNGWGGSGGLAVALVVLAGIAVGALFGRTRSMRQAPPLVAAALSLAAAALAGLAFAGLGALASGSIGPDRLAVSGVQPWAFGGLAVLELGAGMLLGMLAARLDAARLRPARVPAKQGSDDAIDEQVTVPLDDIVIDASEGGGEPESTGDPEHSAREAGPARKPRPGRAVRAWMGRASAGALRGGADAPAGEEAAEPPYAEPLAVEPTEVNAAGSEPTGESADLGDTLVRAYSWDEFDAGLDAEREGEEHPGRRWRLPGGER